MTHEDHDLERASKVMLIDDRREPMKLGMPEAYADIYYRLFKNAKTPIFVSAMYIRRRDSIYKSVRDNGIVIEPFGLFLMFASRVDMLTEAQISAWNKRALAVSELVIASIQ